MNKIQNIEPNKPKFDSLKWILVILLVVAAITANYLFASIAIPLRMIGWIFIFLLAAYVASTTAAGKKLIEFAKEAQVELKKVVWPTRHETVQTTVVVVIMVGIVGLLLWGVDSGLLWAVGKITQIR